MASLLRSNLTFSSPTHSIKTRPISHSKPALTVRCGPRNNRGPLVKGRVLSIEAIQAVQTLKRAHRTNQDDDVSTSNTLSRLLKSDLIAAFNELLRQDHVQIAVKVFSTIRSEESYKTDLNLYANLVKALAKKGVPNEIDHLILDLENEGGGEIPTESKRLTTLIKAVIAAERGEATARIYGMMKRSGWKCNSGAEDYIARILSSGLKRLGQETLGREIDREYRGMSGGVLEKVEGLEAL